MSVFLRTNHLFLRNPRGGVEDIAAMERAGFGAIFCNIGDHEPSEWAVIRQRAKAAGIACGPWLRTAEDANQFSVIKLRYLVAVADAWGGTPFIVNTESEIKGSGSGLTEFIASTIGGRDAAISMEAWPFANVAWYPLADYPFLPQIFPVESEPAKNPNACREEWYKYGIKCVVFTYGAYRGQGPSLYERNSPYGVYTADDCNGYYASWSPQGSIDPCVSEVEEDIMAQIGTQHGITAFINWVKTQPGVPARGPNYKPDDLGTWPWPDKLERTLNILREDHDAEENRELQQKAGVKT